MTSFYTPPPFCRLQNATGRCHHCELIRETIIEKVTYKVSDHPQSGIILNRSQLPLHSRACPSHGLNGLSSINICKHYSAGQDFINDCSADETHELKCSLHQESPTYGPRPGSGAMAYWPTGRRTGWPVRGHPHLH